MSITVDIDKRSGFCAGVIAAITTAEKYLETSEEKCLFSLGSIVHNEEELSRLESKGLITIDGEDLDEMVSAEGKTLLIRAHGEPPKTYTRAEELGFQVIDCTCPVVLLLQKSIREAYLRLHRDGVEGQILIYGKEGHAEVLGLLGQVGGDAVVYENEEHLNRLIAEGKIRLNGPIEVFSQTTKSPSEYARTSEVLARAMATAADDTVAHMLTLGVLHVHDTICAQVATRFKNLSDFALAHDVIIFVSGKTSSNGRVLCELCKSVNIRTYHISTIEELKREWFGKDDKVGVCGATSTPKWLLEQVAQKIANL